MQGVSQSLDIPHSDNHIPVRSDYLIGFYGVPLSHLPPNVSLLAWSMKSTAAALNWEHFIWILFVVLFQFDTGMKLRIKTIVKQGISARKWPQSQKLKILHFSVINSAQALSKCKYWPSIILWLFARCGVPCPLSNDCPVWSLFSC